MSDMDGTKAVHLQDWARARGQAFLRFDYSGHGKSSGAFIDGTIGAWMADARAVISNLITGPIILVGSSMGGWISLLLAQRTDLQIVGFVGIAAAPDFTQDSMLPAMNEQQHQQLEKDGVINIPSDYGDPYPITRDLIEDGRNHLVLRQPLNLPFPVRLLQGDCDLDVTVDRPMAIMAHADCDDLQLHLVKGADHRFSTPAQLDMIVQNLEGLIAFANAPKGAETSEN